MTLRGTEGVVLIFPQAALSFYTASRATLASVMQVQRASEAGTCPAAEDTHVLVAGSVEIVLTGDEAARLAATGGRHTFPAETRWLREARGEGIVFPTVARVPARRPVGVPAARRACARARRRPGARRATSRSAGGGSSGEPHDPDGPGERPRQQAVLLGGRDRLLVESLARTGLLLLEGMGR